VLLLFIDCHMHAFADKIADKAVTQLINYYNINTNFGGRFDDVMAAAAEAGLDGLVLLVAATKAEQVKPANDWVLAMLNQYQNRQKTASQLSSLKIAHFGTFHPDDPDWLAEISRLRSAGIKGLKLHPEFQGIDLASPGLKAFFEEVQHDMVLMIHVGDRVVKSNNLSTPTKIASILDDFPGIKIIAAHLGGYCFWEEVYEVLAGREVYLDTSSSLCYMDLALARKIFAKHGTDKILFGSDFPLRSPKQDFEMLDQIKWLSVEDKERILGLNCAELLPDFKL
jgi:predicted TIM-barrel fold metal-dependent hydrolase